MTTPNSSRNPENDPPPLSRPPKNDPPKPNNDLFEKQFHFY